MARKPASLHTVQDDDWDLDDDVALWSTWLEEDPLEDWVRYWGLRILRLRGRQMGSHWWMLQDRQIMALLNWDEEEYNNASVARKLRRVIDVLRALPKP
ncbi:hypothetical protein, partial [Acidithiobacillus caldus]